MTTQIEIVRETSKDGTNYYVATFLGIAGNRTSDLEGALSSLVGKLFRTRKQLTELPSTFITVEATRTLEGLNAFLPTASCHRD